MANPPCPFRLHLDIVNLRGFIKSMYAGDAKELEHSEVIWNTSHGLMARVDEYISDYRSVDRKSGIDQQREENIAETVILLRRLTSACLGIYRYLETQDGYYRTGINFSDEDWKKLVIDMGQTLHEYRNRDVEKMPRYRQPTLAKTEDETGYDSDDERKAQYSGKWRMNSAFQALKNSMDDLPVFRPDDEDLVVSDMVTLKAGDEVQVRLNNRLAHGIVEKVEHNKKGLFVRYEDLPDCFDEYHPREKVHGRTETIRYLVSTALRPALDMSPNVQEVQCIPSCGPAEVGG